ncbi:MAG: tungstate ABC transporter substrate-binding protein WtpA [Dehalococcoidales bacterium]|nr:tungstate ABC transporter substrate-binding protein WtpA [Dehalococcoidales bacterium]
MDNFRLNKKTCTCLWLCVTVALSLFFSSGCSEKRTELYVMEAGSLVIPFAEIEKAYEAKYPEVDVLLEGHGSIQVIRQVTELEREVDVVAVADWSLIPMMMYTTMVPDTRDAYADWLIQFSTNRLGIAYTPESLYASEITEDNWYEILAREDVLLGFSDPRFDSSGYRAFMLIKMAEEYYGQSGLFEILIAENFRADIKTETDGESTTILIPELLQSKNKRVLLRGSSVQLLSLLESHDIDYCFEYESVAVQQGLNFIELPEEIDMSAANLDEYYARLDVKLDFQRFASVIPVFRGQQIKYGITIPSNAPNPGEAERFIRFLLEEEGQQILRKNHQPVITPAETDGLNNIPDSLKSLVQPN